MTTNKLQNACMHALMASVVSVPLLLSTSAKADVTYTYTGNPYSTFGAFGVWNTSMNTVITATFSSIPMTTTLDLTTTPLLTKFTWFDGVYMFNSITEWTNAMYPTAIGGTGRMLLTDMASMTFDMGGAVSSWDFSRDLVTSSQELLSGSSPAMGDSNTLLDIPGGKVGDGDALPGGTWSQPISTTPASTPGLWSAALLVITTGLLWRRSKAKAEIGL